MRPPVALLAAVLALALPVLPVQAQNAPGGPPGALAAAGPVVVVGAIGRPVWGVGYPLAEWESFFRHGHGTIVGLLSQDSVGLGLGHRFEDYRNQSTGRAVSFTIGPCLTVPLGEGGLRAGRVGVFALIALRPKEGKK